MPNTRFSLLLIAGSGKNCVYPAAGHSAALPGPGVIPVRARPRGEGRPDGGTAVQAPAGSGFRVRCYILSGGTCRDLQGFSHGRTSRG